MFSNRPRPLIPREQSFRQPPRGRRIVSLLRPCANFALGPGRQAPTLTTRHLLRNALVFALVFVGVSALAMYPDAFNRSVASYLVIGALGNRFAQELLYLLSFPTMQGIVTVSLLGGCWFSTFEREPRTRLIAGIFAAVLAGLIADSLQRLLVTSPKPIFDSMLSLDAPAVLGNIRELRALYANSHTFPSPRATMFMALAMAVFLVKPRLGRIALLFTAIPEFARIFLGLHYLTDLIGSLALGAAIVCLSQLQLITQKMRLFATWESVSPGTFYICAYIACFEISTTFGDLHVLATSLAR